MHSTLLLPNDDGQYTCPECAALYKMSNSIRMHCLRKHKMAIRFTSLVPVEIKKQNERIRLARAQDKRKAVRLLIRLFKAAPPLCLFSLRDAKKCGCYEAATPIVVTAPSTIQCAGVFACVDLRAGDIVTTYDGDIVFQVPQEPSYAIMYDVGATPAWIGGLREHQKGKGIGSFVNRADREAN